MKTIITIIFIALLTSMISCEKDKPVPKNEKNSTLILKGSAEEYMDATSSPSASFSDPFDLGDIIVNGNKVEVTVSYPGGCSTHSFQIIWDEAVTLTNPPGVNIVILHDGNNDSCEAYITEVLTFELDSLIGVVGEGEVAIGGFSGWDAGDSSVYEGNKYDISFVESDSCNITVTAREALCGWGLYDNIWFALEDSVNAGAPDFYYSRFLQPVSIAEGLEGFVPVPGQKYIIGARIDNTTNNSPDGVMCLAYPGPSVPVKIMCISESK